MTSDTTRGSIGKESLTPLKGGEGARSALAQPRKKLAVINHKHAQARLRNAAPGALGLGRLEQLLSERERGFVHRLTDKGNIPQPSSDAGNAPHGALSQYDHNADMQSLNVDREKFLERLQQGLDEKGLTWRAASLEIGKDSGFIKDLMRGKTRWPTCEAVAKLCVLLDLRFRWLMFGQGWPKAADHHELSRLIMMLDKDDLSHIEQLARSLAKVKGEKNNPPDEESGTG